MGNITPSPGPICTCLVNGVCKIVAGSTCATCEKCPPTDVVEEAGEVNHHVWIFIIVIFLIILFLYFNTHMKKY